jgi:hypothetical protein
MNLQYGISVDRPKSFIKKTNGCREHGRLLNELFQDVKMKNKALIMTAIHFSNAFRSVPRELIMAMLEQLNFPRWSQQLSRTYIITQNQ